MQLLPSFRKRNNLLSIAALGAGAFFLQGCGLESLQFAACNVNGDPHCFQEAAVQSDDADNCDTVAQKQEFKQVGSNPPRDKCVVMVAANNEDPSTCKKTQGGMYSYNEADCLKGIADSARDPSVCSKLGDANMAACVQSATQNTYDDIDEFSKKPKKTQADIAEIQRKMDELQKLNGMMTNIMKEKFETEKAVISNLRI
ncbi:MAG: hypothetical protein WCK01_04415 [Candidatus Uhrbacteria bacterium]